MFTIGLCKPRLGVSILGSSQRSEPKASGTGNGSAARSPQPAKYGLRNFVLGACPVNQSTGQRSLCSSFTYVWGRSVVPNCRNDLKSKHGGAPAHSPSLSVLSIPARTMETGAVPSPHTLHASLLIHYPSTSISQFWIVLLWPGARSKTTECCPLAPVDAQIPDMSKFRPSWQSG